jgi:hypothetical protein
VPSGSLLRIMQASENLAKIVFTLRRNDCCHSYFKVPQSNFLLCCLLFFHLESLSHCSVFKVRLLVSVETRYQHSIL